MTWYPDIWPVVIDEAIRQEKIGMSKSQEADQQRAFLACEAEDDKYPDESPQDRIDRHVMERASAKLQADPQPESTGLTTDEVNALNDATFHGIKLDLNVDGKITGFSAIEYPESVNHPPHYGGDTTYEAIKVIEAWGLGFNIGNAVKYLSRLGKKPGSSKRVDLEKAIWYLQRELEAGK